MLNIVVVMKIWASKWHNSKVQTKYDNIVLVRVVAMMRLLTCILESLFIQELICLICYTELQM